MLEKKQCKYCKKERQACLFYSIHRRHMCDKCYSMYIKGKKLINGKWIGARKPVNVETRRMYNRRYTLLRKFRDLSTTVW
tara:strand:- start:11378 stop:11617 length:240 start_codon:yes stop_codon:yes gene_type:complete